MKRVLLSEEEYGEKSISVKLDGDEVELSFIDHPSNEMSVRHNLNFEVLVFIEVPSCNFGGPFNLVCEILK